MDAKMHWMVERSGWLHQQGKFIPSRAVVMVQAMKLKTSIVLELLARLLLRTVKEGRADEERTVAPSSTSSKKIVGVEPLYQGVE
jgi:hypothetical protein